MSNTRVIAALVFLLVVSGCGRSPRVAGPPPVTTGPGPVTPGQPALEANAAFEEGQASWYGDPYHGRQSASGEVFDKNKLTAAHRTLAFDTWVRVENQTNGRTVDVRINDRGPFVAGRIIDLSEAAAREIDMIRAGVVPVRMSILQMPDEARSGSRDDVFFVVQVGAFREAGNARALMRRLSNKYTGVYVEPPTRSGSLHLVLIGRARLSDARFVQGRLFEEDGMESIVVQVAEE